MQRSPFSRSISARSFASRRCSDSLINEEGQFRLEHPTDLGDNEQTETPPSAPLYHDGVPSTSAFESQSLRGKEATSRVSHVSSPSVHYSRQNKLRSWSSIVRDWWKEFVCCWLAVGAALAMFATVYPYSDQPLPQWPYNLSINSLISIYALILKAAVLMIAAQGLSQLKWNWFKQTRPLNDLDTFDSASRGSIIGVGQLLWKLRGRQLLASFGALILIITFFLDPLAQQIVRFQTYPFLVPGVSSTVARSNVYLNGGEPALPNGYLTTVPAGMQSAINAGVFIPDALTVPFSCSKGNCTIPEEYHTIGYCSRCDEITSDIIVDPSINTTDGITQISLPETLPGSLESLRSNLTGLFGYRSLNVASTPGPLEPALNGPTSVTEFIFDNRGYLDEFPAAAKWCNDTGDKSWSCQSYAAARCSLSACTKSYRSSVLNGKLMETLIAQHSSFGPETLHRYVSSVNMACVSDTQKSALRNLGYNFNSTTEWLAYNVSYNLIPEPSDPKPFNPWADTNGIGQTAPNDTLQVVPPECIYQMSSSTELSLGGFFYQYFNGTAAFVSGMAGGTSSIMEQIFDGSNITFNSVSKLWDDVANSMTVHMRAKGAEGRSAPATGQTFETETCVRVRWAWLTFPAALSVLTVGFFAAILVQARPTDEASDHDYKASSVALMFHGLEGRDDGQSREMGRLSALEKEAGSTYVRLRPTGRGWKFVQA